MGYFAYFIYYLAQALDTVANIYLWIVIISALLSWVNPDPYNPIVRILRKLTEPVFYRVRRLLPFTYYSGIDFSPIVVILVIQFLIRGFLVHSLFRLAGSMTGRGPIIY